MKVTNFDKANLPAIRKDIDAALKAVSEKYGIAINIGNISFSNSSFTAKMTAATLTEGQDSNINPKWKSDFDRKAWILEANGLPRGSFGKKFILSGKECKIVGAQPVKDNLIVQYTNDTKFWTIPAEKIIAAFKAQAK